MSRLLWLLMLLAWPGAPAPAQNIEHVLLVSVDGLLPATYTAPETLGVQAPTLRTLAREGSYSPGALSVFPSVTYPAHTTLATGTDPAHHGIFTNRAWDPMGRNQGGWRWYAEDLRARTLWQAAQERGLRTALIWWPVTVGAQATALVPEYWRAQTPEDVKLVRALSTPGLLEDVGKRFPGFRAGFAPPSVKDEALMDIAVHVVETVRPHLLMMHIAQVDYWSHREGPSSPLARNAVENADRQIARLIAAAQTAGIWERSALVVVSDHGFRSFSRLARPGVLLRQRGLVSLDAQGQVSAWEAVVMVSGGSAYVYLRDSADESTRRAVQQLFQSQAGKPGSGIGSLHQAEQIRAMGGDPNAFLALEAAEGFAFAGGYTGEYSEDFGGAAHGYNPGDPQMRASLLMYGPSIAPRKLEGARLLDVAPTIARWLGLKMEGMQGQPLDVPASPGK